jgi:hypothetical protein
MIQNINEIETGDILLERGTGFLSRAIVKEMEIYAKKNHIAYKEQEIWSHAGTLLWLNNEFHIRRFDLHYELLTPVVCILRKKKEYTEAEKAKVVDAAMHLQVINLGYQYTNFIQWLAKIHLGIDLFSKGGNQWTYCFESTYRILKQADSITFDKNPEETNIFMLYDLTKFDRIF